MKTAAFLTLLLGYALSCNYLGYLDACSSFTIADPSCWTECKGGLPTITDNIVIDGSLGLGNDKPKVTISYLTFTAASLELKSVQVTVSGGSQLNILGNIWVGSDATFSVGSLSSYDNKAFINCSSSSEFTIFGRTQLYWTDLIVGKVSVHATLTIGSSRLLGDMSIYPTGELILSPALSADINSLNEATLYLSGKLLNSGTVRDEVPRSKGNKVFIMGNPKNPAASTFANGGTVDFSYKSVSFRDVNVINTKLMIFGGQTYQDTLIVSSFISDENSELTFGTEFDLLGVVGHQPYQNNLQISKAKLSGGFRLLTIVGSDQSVILEDFKNSKVQLSVNGGSVGVIGASEILGGNFNSTLFSSPADSQDRPRSLAIQSTPTFSASNSFGGAITLKSSGKMFDIVIPELMLDKSATLTVQSGGLAIESITGGVGSTLVANLSFTLLKEPKAFVLPNFRGDLVFPAFNWGGEALVTLVSDSVTFNSLTVAPAVADFSTFSNVVLGLDGSSGSLNGPSSGSVIVGNTFKCITAAYTKNSRSIGISYSGYVLQAPNVVAGLGSDDKLAVTVTANYLDTECANVQSVAVTGWGASSTIDYTKGKAVWKPVVPESDHCNEMTVTAKQTGTLKQTGANAVAVTGSTQIPPTGFLLKVPKVSLKFELLPSVYYSEVDISWDKSYFRTHDKVCDTPVKQIVIDDFGVDVSDGHYTLSNSDIPSCNVFTVPVRYSYDGVTSNKIDVDYYNIPRIVSPALPRYTAVFTNDGKSADVSFLFDNTRCACGGSPVYTVTVTGLPPVSSTTPVIVKGVTPSSEILFEYFVTCTSHGQDSNSAVVEKATFELVAPEPPADHTKFYIIGGVIIGLVVLGIVGFFIYKRYQRRRQYTNLGISGAPPAYGYQ